MTSLLDDTEPELWTGPSNVAGEVHIGPIVPSEHHYSATEIRRAEEARATACVVPEGWQLVPVDATKSMIDRAAAIDWGGNDDVVGNCHNMWNSMLAAAPQPPVAEPRVNDE